MAFGVAPKVKETKKGETIYCDDCAKKCGWPRIYNGQRMPCPVCGESRICNIIKDDKYKTSIIPTDRPATLPPKDVSSNSYYGKRIVKPD
jgi:hypothetical protein